MFERFKCVRVNHHTGRFVRVPTLFCTSVSDGVAQIRRATPAPTAIPQMMVAPWLHRRR